MLIYNVRKINCTIYGADSCEQLSDFSEHKKIALNRNFLCRKFQNLSGIFMHPKNPTNKPHTLVCGKQEGFFDYRLNRKRNN